MKLVFLAVILAFLFCALFILGATAVKAGETIIEFKDMELGDLKVAGFELAEKGGIEIFAIGAITDYSDCFSAYGWIIDAEDRNLVWSQNEDCDDYSHISDVLAECEDRVILKPGRYEAYYYVGKPGIQIGGGQFSIDDLGDLIDLLGDAISLENEIDAEKFYEDDAEELTFVVKTDDRASPYMPRFETPKNTIMRVERVEADELHQLGFTLSKEIALSIYAIGEYSDSYEIFADGAWIIDADTRKIVWNMDKWNTRRAGGADKNRRFRKQVTLPAGNYIAYFATDDSHDFSRWNAAPPEDPFNYGITIATVNPDDMKYVAEYIGKVEGKEIVSMTRVRDNAFEKEGLILKKKARLHIKAYGERSYSDEELVDYGWIVDADNLDKVWEMDYDNTVFGGGHVKNCHFDGIIELLPGNYMIYYRTDDSHSYRRWNTAPPFNRREYGISIYAITDLSTDDYELVDRFHPAGNLLVDLTGLGDGENRSQKFTLKETTDIRVTAIGEGKSGYMYDYGWIEDDEGEIIWEMTYRKTSHAGGASKNRIVAANVTLRSGKYIAYFVTDDSHSYEGFNASPPDDPERWGMVITLK